MLRNFLFDSTKVYVDYKRNRLYVSPQLHEVYLDIRDTNGALIPLESFILQARASGEKQWEQHEWLRYLPGVFQCSNEIPHNELSTFAHNAGFLFGILFERARTKKGLSVDVKTRKMTSEEMDKIARDFEEKVLDASEEEESA
jgi:hypothetical protein